MRAATASITVALILAQVIIPTYAASLLDLLDWDADAAKQEKRDDGNSDLAPTRTCACNGPACMCCVDFNLTYIDLGGPGCIQMKYISQDEGIAVNVSYGESLLHSEQVKGSNPAPTCMALLTNLAQICARFTELQPQDDGLRSCVALEPKLLGQVSTSFDVGCFTMGPEGMKLENTNTSYVSLLENVNSPSNSSNQGSEELNEEDLLAAVNETAEQGLAFFGNLLGLTFGKPQSNSTTTESEQTTSGSQRSSKSIYKLLKQNLMNIF